jgi:hypothetical protein
MQRISFDFMNRRIKQFAYEASRIARHFIPMTAEDHQKAMADAELMRKLTPVTRYGSVLMRAAKDSDSRPVRRRLARIAAFNDITKSYPGEPRHRRRLMAFGFVRNMSKVAA